MSHSLKKRGEVPFPNAGDGAFIQFTVEDIAKLEEEYGEGRVIQEASNLLNEGSAKCTRLCLETGLKHKDGDEVTLLAIDFSQPLDWALTEAAEPILDALCLAVLGKTFEEVLEEQAKLISEASKVSNKTGGEEDDPFPASKAQDDTKPSETPPE